MPRKKKDQTPPPPAQTRSIECAFCQKELNPLTDAVRFIGMGKWRDGPGIVHAVCSAKTQEGQENPCFVNGMAWAMKFTKEKPVVMSFDEWKALPVRRRATASRSASGRYELHLTESHLNSIYFIEHKRASNAVRARDVIERWQSDWSLRPEDIPDIDKLEREAHQDDEVERIRNMPLKETHPAAVQAELPEELKKEMDRHTEKYFEHFRKNVLADGDECKSCRISRGMKKLHAIALWLPAIERAIETIGAIKESGDSFGCFMTDCRKLLNNATGSLCEAMGLKPDDENHNEIARKRNDEDIRFAKTMLKKYGVKS
jgi:hypothetical protein